MDILGQTYSNEDGLEFLELVKFYIHDPSLESVFFFKC